MFVWCDLKRVHGEWVSSPEEFHPKALADPYVNVSAHTAPIIQL